MAKKKNEAGGIAPVRLITKQAASYLGIPLKKFYEVTFLFTKNCHSPEFGKITQKNFILVDELKIYAIHGPDALIKFRLETNRLSEEGHVDVIARIAKIRDRRKKQLAKAKEVFAKPAKQKGKAKNTKKRGSPSLNGS